MTRTLNTRRGKFYLAGMLAVALGVTGLLLFGRQQLNNDHASPGAVVCDGRSDTTAALQAAVSAGGTVNVPAGTCVISTHIKVTKPVVINGAGMTATHIVQHGHESIFGVTADGVTIENIDLNVAQFNPGVPPIKKNPVPMTIFDTGNNQTLLNVSSEAGTGFGMRFTGPSPCDTYQRHGLTATHIVTTNTGVGGFTAFDVDCHDGFALNDITVHGDYIALFQDINGTVTNENFTLGPYTSNGCPPDIYVTGNAANIAIKTVTSYGGHHVFKSGVITNVTITGEVVTKPGC